MSCVGEVISAVCGVKQRHKKRKEGKLIQPIKMRKRTVFINAVYSQLWEIRHMKRVGEKVFGVIALCFALARL